MIFSKKSHFLSVHFYPEDKANHLSVKGSHLEVFRVFLYLIAPFFFIYYPYLIKPYSTLRRPLSPKVTFHRLDLINEC